MRSHVTNLKAELEAAGHPLTIDAVKEQLARFIGCQTHPSKNRLTSLDPTIRECSWSPLSHAEGGMGFWTDGLTAQSIVDAISNIEQSYLRPEFLYGRHSSALKEYRKRIEGAGEVIVSIGLEEKKIKTVDIKGDYFGTGVEGSTTLQNLLQGLPLKEKALKGKDLGIMGLTPEQLNSLIFSKKETVN